MSDISHLKSWILRDPEEIEHEVEAVPTVHEQEDGTILGCCATGSSSRDSLLSWIRFLEKTNPKLADFPVLFTLKSPLGNFFFYMIFVFFFLFFFTFSTNYRFSVEFGSLNNLADSNSQNIPILGKSELSQFNALFSYYC